MNLKNYHFAVAVVGLLMMIFTDILSDLLSVREEHGFIIAGAILIGSASIGLAINQRK
jgi:hypothetical protein